MALKKNIIYIYFKGKHQVTSKSQYQYNRGQYLYFADLNLPQAFEVHFSNRDKGESKTQIGSDNLVEIPDEYFWNGALQIYAWIYLHSKTTDGETIYEVRIPLTKRAKPTDEEPLPVQQSTIDRAIAELNNAVDITNENVNKTNSDKTIVANIKDEVVILKENIDSTAVTINQKAQETINASERAETSAQNAAASERKALDYSQQAEQSAQSALESKNIANQKAEIAADASAEALSYRNESLEARDQAVQAKKNIVDYRDETKEYRDETSNLKNDVQTLKGQIEDISDTVNENAQSASQSASSASQSASSASQSASNASQSASQAEEFMNQSEANVTHYPKVIDGYWYVWDATNEEYVNTNVDARGVKGDVGESGVYIGTEEPTDPDVDVWIDSDGTPDGISDVQINGTSIVENGVANVPPVQGSSYGVVKLGSNSSVSGLWSDGQTGMLYVATASSALIKQGANRFNAITSLRQHESTFYGLAKSAGDTTQSASSNAVGNYTDNAKDKIQTMLGVSPFIAPHESDPFESAHAIGELFIINGKLYRAKTALAAGEYINEGTNVEVVDVAEVLDGKVGDVQINGTSVVTDGVANIPRATTGVLGVVRPHINSFAFDNDGRLVISAAGSSHMKEGTNSWRPIMPNGEHIATFYGLAKASGDTTQSQSNNAVGTYTDEAKASIKNMLGVQDNMVVTVEQNETSDWQADKTYTEIRNAIIKGINVIVDDDTYLLPYVGQLYQNNIIWFAFGVSTVFNNINTLFGYLIGYNNEQTIVTQINQNTPIPQINDLTTGSDIVWSSSKIKDELDYKVSDVQIDGSSIVTDGVAEIPMSATNKLGVCGVNGEKGIGAANGILQINGATSVGVKNGQNGWTPITPLRQHESVFYGLTKAAGVDMASSSNAVGTYTDEAKTAIKTMLGVHDTYDSFIEEVTGTDVTITGQPSYRYNCGEVYSLTVTPPSSGTIDIRFISGSTPTVLTLPSTIKMPEWWVEVEANTIYEMCITDGIYCGVMSWAM